jgi:hypothetical protein
VPPDQESPDGPEAGQRAPESNHLGGPSNGNSGSQGDPREALLRDVEKTRLPPELRAQMLAEYSPEEEERIIREMQEKGGLSSEEFFASLGLDAEPES